MNLNFDNKAWMLIFIIGFVMVLLTSKCLCNNEKFININDGNKSTNYTIKLDNKVLVLCDSKNEPLLIGNSKITIDNRIKTISDLKETLDKSRVLNMSFINNKGTIVSLILYDFKKENISVNNNIIQINNAKFKKL
jgi:hypothetical protein